MLLPRNFPRNLGSAQGCLWISPTRIFQGSQNFPRIFSQPQEHSGGAGICSEPLELWVRWEPWRSWIFQTRGLGNSITFQRENSSSSHSKGEFSSSSHPIPEWNFPHPIPKGNSRRNLPLLQPIPEGNSPLLPIPKGNPRGNFPLRPIPHLSTPKDPSHSSRTFHREGGIIPVFR